jgi:Ca2+/Na+ antiporter
MNDPQTPQIVASDASRQVSGPATGLLVTGIIGAFFAALTLIASIVGMSIAPFIRDEIPERYAEFWEGSVGAASSVVGLAVAAFIIFAALKMRELKQWELCLAASIVAMIPCISPCCILGLPIGIWALVVLLRPEIKEAFH